MANMPTPSLKRVHDAPSSGDGTRVLVDRLWPRGLSRDKAKIDIWLRDIAPSDALRREFHAKPERWNEFRSAYADELKGNEALPQLRALCRKRRVTLLYASKDEAHNNAVALRDLLRRT
ncbi:MAG: DUF488 family protein [Thermomonas sp.]